MAITGVVTLSGEHRCWVNQKTRGSEPRRRLPVCGRDDVYRVAQRANFAQLAPASPTLAAILLPVPLSAACATSSTEAAAHLCSRPGRLRGLCKRRSRAAAITTGQPPSQRLTELLGIMASTHAAIKYSATSAGAGPAFLHLRFRIAQFAPKHLFDIDGLIFSLPPLSMFVQVRLSPRCVSL